MGSHLQQKLLRKVYMACMGKCTKCGIVVGIVADLTKNGWELDHPLGVLRHKSGSVIGMATLEHILPRAKGGTNNVKNLTLFCCKCNRETSATGRS